jgi:conjugal transfer pilus assembly protein TraL
MNIRIPQHLDEPERYFIFTPDELVVVIVPLLILTIISHFFVALMVSSLAFWSLRRLKRGGGLNRLIWDAYWLLPSSIFGLKATPPSFERLFVG